MNEYEKIRSEVFIELKRKATSFIGRRVRVWTKYNQPVEGTLIFLSLTSPFIMILMDDEGRPRMFNLTEVVEIESKEKFKIP